MVDALGDTDLLMIFERQNTITGKHKCAVCQEEIKLAPVSKFNTWNLNVIMVGML